MTHMTPYHPPAGTVWGWHPKKLNYSPWSCDLVKQREPSLYLHSVRILCLVYKIETEWKWVVQMTDFNYQYSEVSGIVSDPLEACLAAEKEGEAQLDKLLPAWVRQALLNKWRPPAQSTD